MRTLTSFEIAQYDIPPLPPDPQPFNPIVSHLTIEALQAFFFFFSKKKPFVKMKHFSVGLN